MAFLYASEKSFNNLNNKWAKYNLGMLDLGLSQFLINLSCMEEHVNTVILFLNTIINYAISLDKKGRENYFKCLTQFGREAYAVERKEYEEECGGYYRDYEVENITSITYTTIRKKVIKDAKDIIGSESTSRFRMDNK
jgi:hypothetical protein